MQAKYGTGSIFKMPDGRYKWQGFFIDETGKRHRPSKIFKTEAEALRFQAEQLQKLEVEKAKNAITKRVLIEESRQYWKHCIRQKCV